MTRSRLTGVVRRKPHESTSVPTRVRRAPTTAFPCSKLCTFSVPRLFRLQTASSPELSDKFTLTAQRCLPSRHCRVLALAYHFTPRVSANFNLPFYSFSPRSWKALLAAVTPDTSPLPRRLYRPAMMVMGTIHLFIGGAVAVKILTMVGGTPSKVQ